MRNVRDGPDVIELAQLTCAKCASSSELDSLAGVVAVSSAVVVDGVDTPGLFPRNGEDAAVKTMMWASFVLAVLVIGSFPARADDVTTIRERLKAASASVHSVAIDMEMSPPGAAMPNMPRSINILMIVAGPGLAKALAVVGPMQIETYQVDGMVYVHIMPGDSWRKMSYDPAHPPAQALDLLRASKNEQIALLPDTLEDGLAVGVVQIEMQLPVPTGTASVGPPVSLTCNYDKVTYYMRSCANPTMSMTFTKYNDPSNTVDLPSGAASAVLVVPATPLPEVTAPAAIPTVAPSAAPSAQP